jgi:lipoprotein LprG
MLRRIGLAVVVAPLIALSVAACGGDDKAAPEEKRDILLERLTEARAKIDNAETIKIKLAAKNLPDGTAGLLSANGSGNHTPAFTGTVKVVTGGSSIAAEVIAVGAEVMAKPSFSPVFITVDPASLKAPNPAGFFETSTGLSQILVQTEGLKEGEKSRDGEDVLTTISGNLPGTVVRAILPSADVGATFPVTYRLTDDNELRDASITGPFYPKIADVTYTLKMSTSDTPTSITLPE